MAKKASKAGKYKLKTHKATSKRFRRSAGGKLLRTKGGKSHLRRRKSARTKAQLAEMVTVQGRSYKKRVARLAPNLGK